MIKELFLLAACTLNMSLTPTRNDAFVGDSTTVSQIKSNEIYEIDFGFYTQWLTTLEPQAETTSSDAYDLMYCNDNDGTTSTRYISLSYNNVVYKVNDFSIFYDGDNVGDYIHSLRFISANAGLNVEFAHLTTSGFLVLNDIHVYVHFDTEPFLRFNYDANFNVYNTFKLYTDNLVNYTGNNHYVQINRNVLLDYFNTIRTSYTQSIDFQLSGTFKFLDDVNGRLTGVKYGVVYQRMTLYWEPGLNFVEVSCGVFNGESYTYSSIDLDVNRNNIYLYISSPLYNYSQSLFPNLQYQLNYGRLPDNAISQYLYEPSYDFNDLAITIVDTPLYTLFSLLNFNVLGVNIFAMVSGLLTALLVVFVIKKLV